MAELQLTYLLPIRSDVPPSDELTDYLRGVSRRCPVVIVDGSPEPVFDRAHAAWADLGLHIRPDPRRACANGKVHGVLTGLDHVRTEMVVIADDDVRYGPEDLDRTRAALADADLVVPQNYFSPLPWHARWDSARTLLNRVTGGDFPGTLAVRIAPLRASGGYDGDVLFENLELMRTVRAAGGVCVARPDLYIRRLPPTTRHFLSQRVRQAYDEFARPWRLAAFLAVLPAVAMIARRRPALLLGAAAGTVVLAETGRRSNGGRAYFARSSSLLAPVWILERAACAWAAIWVRARGGVPYHGDCIVRAANSPAELRRRAAGAAAGAIRSG